LQRVNASVNGLNYYLVDKPDKLVKVDKPDKLVKRG